MATSLAKISSVIDQCRAAAQHYGVPAPSVLQRVVSLKARERFRPKESFLWGLADPRQPRSLARAFASRGQLYRLQATHNPMSLTYLTEDKAVFYAVCGGAGVRVPRLHGLYHAGGGWVTGGGTGAAHGQRAGRRMQGVEQWLNYFGHGAPDSVVIKPSKGVYARGLRVLTRSGSGWVDSHQQPVDIAELLQALDADGAYDRFVIQDRLSNHPDLLKLSGSQALQTARVVTLVDQQHQPHVLFACFKVINSDHLSDNFDYGTSGNLLADIDLESGALGSVVGRHPSGFGLENIDHHPRSGLRFADVSLPFWQETRQLAEHAAVCFLPLRTIGWDIAITADGPSIVEGNVWWDGLHNAHGHLPRYINAVRREAANR